MFHLFFIFFGLAFYRFALFVVLVGVFSQALIFNNGHDAVLKQAMKNRKTPPEALSYGGIEELVKDELNRPSWSVLQTFPIVLKQTSFLKVFSSVTHVFAGNGIMFACCRTSTSRLNWRGSSHTHSHFQAQLQLHLLSHPLKMYLSTS